jgi:hypothetical protein
VTVILVNKDDAHFTRTSGVNKKCVGFVRILTAKRGLSVTASMLRTIRVSKLNSLSTRV